MAIPDNYIDKITKGNDSRMISPAADMVRVDNDNFDGETLDEVLDDVYTKSEVDTKVAEAGSGAVSVTTNQDGTFVIHVGSTDYTINLNHTHENMAKLEKHTTATMPDASEMESDTIYAEIEDGEVNVLYIGGVPFYGGGGGGTSTPVLRQPADGSTIDVGKIASGESSVTKTITVKGKNLTQALTVAVTGTGYSVNKQSISAADANVGTTLTITCTNTDESAEGTLSIGSSEVANDCDLVANLPAYESLAGVKFTGTQWLQTDYKPNANTEFDIDMRFELNSKSNTQGALADIGGKFLDCTDTNNKKFAAYNGQANNYNQFGSRIINFINESSIIYGSGYQQLKYNNDEDTAGQSAFLAEHFILSYIKQSSNGVLQAVCGGLTRSCNTSLKTTKMSSPMVICYDINNNKIYEKFDLTIYEMTFKENGTTVMHLTPVMRNGVPGLIDTVSQVFYRSETAKTSGLSSDELVAIPLT